MHQHSGLCGRGIFTAVGDTGLLLTEQVFIAETTSLVNRGLLAAIPEAVGGVVALVAGSIAAGQVLAHAGWRWGYGMWSIVLPVCAAPLDIIMLRLERRGAACPKHQWPKYPRESHPSYPLYLGRA